MSSKYKSEDVKMSWY